MHYSGHDHNIEWTITGEAFEECIAPGWLLNRANKITKQRKLISGEKIVFNWEGDAHNVEKVNAAGYEGCSGIKNTDGVEGPFTFAARRAGTYYFVCGVGGHCEFGKQKAKITVDPSC